MAYRKSHTDVKTIHGLSRGYGYFKQDLCSAGCKDDAENGTRNRAVEASPGGG